MELVRAFQQLELELHFRLLIFESRLLVREYSIRKRDVLTKWHFYSNFFIPDIYNYIHITDDIRHTHTCTCTHSYMYMYIHVPTYNQHCTQYLQVTNKHSIYTLVHVHVHVHTHVPTNRHYTCTHTNKHSIYMYIHVPINRHVDMYMYKQTL